MCNQAKIEIKSKEPEAAHDEEGLIGSPQTRTVIGGNGVDKALLSWAEDVGVVDDILTRYSTQCIIPFSSATKLTVVVVQDGEVEATPNIVIVKGAPEYVLAKCTHYYDDEGAIKPLGSALLDSMRAMVDQAASAGQRVIAIAERSLPTHSFPPSFVFDADSANFPTDEMVFVACIAIADPPREGVADAVAALRTAGIKVAMVTGDASNTALSIARQV
jgi:sodium/potassium-transporting ATPase subunit alpha